MRLLSFLKDGAPAPGIARDGKVLDLSSLDPEMPRDWATLIAEDNLERLRALAEHAPADHWVPRDGLTMALPIPRPPKILCAGLNYMSHAQEVGMELPKHPILFTRYATSLVPDGEPLVRPSASEKYDYESELVAVIGRSARAVPASRALDHVIGYSIMNDGSLRDFQKKGGQWTLGKNFDRSGSFGPEIVTSDELPDGARGLRISATLNGETVQDGTTDDLIFDVARLVEAASEVMTLEPGTILATGTPPGVGMARTPRLWLKPGDTIACSVQGIGTLENEVVAEA
jgi:2-keto-4-pentenoate hydratase/2-oxohepta-3-ene-1,7-dioic acid hydratase in catechol pathway